MARYDDLPAGPIAYAAFVSSILLVIIILLVRALCYSWIEAEDASKMRDASYVAADLEIARQKAQFDDYDKKMVAVAAPGGEAEAGAPTEEERLVIPIERAQEVLLQDLQQAGSPGT